VTVGCDCVEEDAAETVVAEQDENVVDESGWEIFGHGDAGGRLESEVGSPGDGAEVVDEGVAGGGVGELSGEGGGEGAFGVDEGELGKEKWWVGHGGLRWVS
jgi:hypothetical protein